MSVENNSLWNVGINNENLNNFQKAQKEFAENILSQGAELQKKQFALFTSIIQNQVQYGSDIFSNAMNILNDNSISKNSKAEKQK